MPETFVDQSLSDRPLWTAPRLACVLAIHHFTLLKKVQDKRGKFEIPEGAFKLGNSWRWRDEDVRAFLLKKSGAGSSASTENIEPKKPATKRKPGRPRKSATALKQGAVA